MGSGNDTLRTAPASIGQELRWRSSGPQVANRVYRLRGPVDPVALQRALALLVRRHEALRCSLHGNGGLRMLVHPEAPAPLRQIPAQGDSLAAREAWLAAWIEEEVRTGFDRGSPPLLRASLVRLDEEDYALILVVDHIVTDGWSVEILAREIGEEYGEAVGGSPSARGEVAQFPAWVEEEREAVTEERLDSREEFWRGKCPGGPGDLGVWLPGYRPPADDARPERTGLLLPADLSDAIKEAARSLRVTLYVLTATLLARLLQQESGEERVTLASASATRLDAETASMVGYLDRSIWVPTTLGGHEDLGAATEAFQWDLLEVIEMADVPPRALFERMWGPDARERMMSVPQIGFLCAPFWGDSLSLPGVEVVAGEADDGAVDGPLSVFLAARSAALEVQVISIPGTLPDGYSRELGERYVAELTAVAERIPRR
jgi:hypothetical protein